MREAGILFAAIDDNWLADVRAASFWQLNNGATMAKPRIYVDQHLRDDGQEFFSVNVIDGDGGWQFGEYATRKEARQAARRVADEIEIEVCKIIH